MDSPFVHLELSTKDVNKAKEFYGSLFEWKLEDMPMGNGLTYTMVKTGKDPGGGMMAAMPGSPVAWLPYVLVEDVAKSTKKAKDLGATIVKDKTDIPNMGAFSIIVDPTGATIGLFQNIAK